MSNTKAARPAKRSGAKTLAVRQEPNETEKLTLARSVTAPTVRGAVTIEAFSKAYGETDLGALMDVLRAQNEKVQGGDMKRAESLLMTQAHTLDAIFNELARRAAVNMGDYLNATERYMRLALKAQSQCRATLEALAAIKNPPVIYARQANIANGPQQINNGPLPAHAGGENTIDQNKLLEANYGQRLDTGTPGTAIGADPGVATLAEIDRAAHS